MANAHVGRSWATVLSRETQIKAARRASTHRSLGEDAGKLSSSGAGTQTGAATLGDSLAGFHTVNRTLSRGRSIHTPRGLPEGSESVCVDRHMGERSYAALSCQPGGTPRVHPLGTDEQTVARPFRGLLLGGKRHESRKLPGHGSVVLREKADATGSV